MQLLYATFLSIFLIVTVCHAKDMPRLRGNALDDNDNRNDDMKSLHDENSISRRLVNIGNCYPRECARKMANNRCDEECNHVGCYYDGGDCEGGERGRRDNSFRLTLGTSDIHRYAYSHMDAKLTVYATSGTSYSFNIKEYGRLPRVGESEIYDITLPSWFDSLNEDKIKIEATNDDGWCFDLVKIGYTEMNLRAECEEGNCDRKALWLDEISWSERNKAFIGNYAKAESWTLSSYNRPRKH
mmetsp:Transcript_8035/g.13306  ORF Transcript_8035/g.13306 Transcript_8035/m.13306 type:complete len:242 (-) Transcript_8035:226-951(-)